MFARPGQALLRVQPVGHPRQSTIGGISVVGSDSRGVVSPAPQWRSDTGQIRPYVDEDEQKTPPTCDADTDTPPKSKRRGRSETIETCKKRARRQRASLANEARLGRVFSRGAESSKRASRESEGEAQIGTTATIGNDRERGRSERAASARASRTKQDLAACFPEEPSRARERAGSLRAKPRSERRRRSGAIENVEEASAPSAREPRERSETWPRAFQRSRVERESERGV
jgi:hypothetical protein